EVFGWSALLNRPVSTMSAIATDDCRLLVLDGKRVHQLCSQDTDLGYRVLQELVELVSIRLSNAKRTLAHVLSVTSHDLRAPLATVESSLDAVIGGFAGETTSKQNDLLNGGKQRISDLLNMIDNILDISHVEIRARDFEKTDLSEVIANSFGDVEGIARQKRIELIDNTSRNLPPVLSLPKRLRQVITNLLSNGVKFTSAGGKVTISSKETDDKVRLDVTDTGIGILPEELPKIFADFYRGAKVEAEGAGLGLAIAKKIIEAHGGTIWAESPDPETGKGTRFSFSLPKILEVVKVQEEETPLIRRAKILVADDDPEMRKITVLVLESQGYQVYTAEDGEQALKKIDEEEPDLLVLDLLMPRLDGFEVCKILEERRRSHGGKRIPVVILSAVKEDSGRQRYELETEMDLDIDDYVTKPISPPVLLQRVERALRKGKTVGATGLAITKGGKQWTDDQES
ncbi:ATP-binding protein, partial [Chloroflexota bacterium]